MNMETRESVSLYVRSEVIAVGERWGKLSGELSFHLSACQRACPSLGSDVMEGYEPLEHVF